MATLEKVLKANPGHLDSVMLLGQIHERGGRLSAAIKVYQQALDRTSLPRGVQAGLRSRIQLLRQHQEARP